LTLGAFSRFNLVEGLPVYDAYVLPFFIITVAAAEVAVGLAIIVALFRCTDTTDATKVSTTKYGPRARPAHRFAHASEQPGLVRPAPAPPRGGGDPPRPEALVRPLRPRLDRLGPAHSDLLHPPRVRRRRGRGNEVLPLDRPRRGAG